MPLFRCVKCGWVENTALSFHFEHLDDHQYLCSECDQEIAKWHGEFDKVSAEGFYYDANHYIYEPDMVDADTMEWKYNRRFKMVGRVVNNEMINFNSNNTDKEI